MLTAEIQKIYTTVYFIKSKIENPILSFLIWNFATESISFSKRKQLNNGFNDWQPCLILFLFFFLCYLHKRSPIEKSKGREKCGPVENLFIIKPVIISNSWLSATDSALLKLMGPYIFIPVLKLWFQDKLSMYSYELWAMCNEI